MDTENPVNLAKLHDTNLERRLLSFVMTSSGQHVRRLVRPSDFYHPHHQRLFVLLCTLPAPPDFCAVLDAVEREGIEFSKGELPLLASEWGAYERSVNEEYLALRVEGLPVDGVPMYQEVAESMAKQVHALATTRRIGRQMNRILEVACRPRRYETSQKNGGSEQQAWHEHTNTNTNTRSKRTMKIKQTIYEAVPEGSYEAFIDSINGPEEGKFGPFLKWLFAIPDYDDGKGNVDNRIIIGMASETFSRRSKMFGWTAAALGKKTSDIPQDYDFDSDDVVGRWVQLVLGIKTGEDGEEYNTIEKVMVHQPEPEPQPQKRQRPQAAAQQQGRPRQPTPLRQAQPPPPEQPDNWEDTAQEGPPDDLFE